jgi:hypothetical protein
LETPGVHAQDDLLNLTTSGRKKTPDFSGVQGLAYLGDLAAFITYVVMLTADGRNIIWDIGCRVPAIASTPLLLRPIMMVNILLIHFACAVAMYTVDLHLLNFILTKSVDGQGVDFTTFTYCAFHIVLLKRAGTSLCPKWLLKD